MRGAELVEQLLVGGRLFEGVQVGAVDVLEQGIAEHRVVAGVAHDGRDGVLADGLGGAPAAFTHDQLVRAVAEVAHHDGLEEADLADRELQLLERLLVEDLTRLLRVRLDRGDRQLGEARTRHGRQLNDGLAEPGLWHGLGRRRKLSRRGSLRRGRTGFLRCDGCRRRGRNQSAQAPAEASPWTVFHAVPPLLTPLLTPRIAISSAASK